MELSEKQARQVAAYLKATVRTIVHYYRESEMMRGYYDQLIRENGW